MKKWRLYKSGTGPAYGFITLTKSRRVNIPSWIREKFKEYNHYEIYISDNFIGIKPMKEKTEHGYVLIRNRIKLKTVITKEFSYKKIEDGKAYKCKAEWDEEENMLIIDLGNVLKE